MGKEFLCLSREPGSGGESCLEVVDEVAADAAQSSRWVESSLSCSAAALGSGGNYWCKYTHFHPHFAHVQLDMPMSSLGGTCLTQTHNPKGAGGS